MIKVNQLPPDTNLVKVQFRLTPELLKHYSDYCGGEEKMWFIGPLMGDWFVSPQSPEEKDEKGSRRLFPMPEQVSPADLLECEVVSILGLKDIMDIFNEDELENLKNKT